MFDTRRFLVLAFSQLHRTFFWICSYIRLRSTSLIGKAVPTHGSKIDEFWHFYAAKFRYRIPLYSSWSSGFQWVSWTIGLKVNRHCPWDDGVYVTLFCIDKTDPERHLYETLRLQLVCLLCSKKATLWSTSLLRRQSSPWSQNLLGCVYCSLAVLVGLARVTTWIVALRWGNWVVWFLALLLMFVANATFRCWRTLLTWSWLLLQTITSDWFVPRDRLPSPLAVVATYRTISHRLGTPSTAHMILPVKLRLIHKPRH